MNCTQLQNRRIHFEQSERWLNVLLDASLVRMRCSILCYIILSYFKLDQYSNALTIFMQLYRVLLFFFLLRSGYCQMSAIKLDGLRTAETMYMVAQKAQTTNKRALSTQPLLSLSALHTLLIVVDWVAMHYGYWSQRWPQRTCISHT